MTFSPDHFISQESFRNWAQGLDEADCRYWDAWVQAHPAEAPAAYLAAAIVTGVQFKAQAVPEAVIESEWLRLQSRIKTAPAQRLREARVISINRWQPYAIAASILMLLGFFAFLYMRTPVTQQYATGRDQKKTIRLDDGTRIVLNPNSRLTTRSEGRFAPARETWLEGEAFFSVVSHKQDADLKHFVVHTTGLDVNVVGTQFNVNARDQKTRVFLNEGKVRLTLVENMADTLDMQPGDYVVFDRDKNAASKVERHKETKYVQTFREGFFFFDRTPLADVFELAERTYSVKMTVSDPRLLQEPVSGKIPTGSLSALCNSIANLYQLEYSRTAEEIRFEPKAKRKPTP